MLETAAQNKSLNPKNPLNWENILTALLVVVIFVAAIGSFILFSSKSTVETWKVFQSNQEVGVSFEYPSNWRTVKSEGADMPVLIPVEENSLGVTIYCYPQSSDKIIGWLASHEDLVSSEQISIGGYNARKIHSQGRGGGERLELLVKEVDCSGKLQTLRLTMYADKTISPKYKSYFDHIISSFKFVD
jgi:hypothetical protein